MMSEGDKSKMVKWPSEIHVLDTPKGITAKNHPEDDSPS